MRASASRATAPSNIARLEHAAAPRARRARRRASPGAARRRSSDRRIPPRRRPAAAVARRARAPRPRAGRARCTGLTNVACANRAAISGSRAIAWRTTSTGVRPAGPRSGDDADVRESRRRAARCRDTGPAGCASRRRRSTTVDARRVDAERPAPRPRRMPAQAERARQDRAAAIGRDASWRPARAVVCERCPRRASTRPRTTVTAMRVVDERPAHDHARFESRARGDRLVEQPRVEVAARDRAAGEPAAVPRLRTRARGPVTQHAGERPARSRAGRRASPSDCEERHGAGVERVAAELVARKRLAIDDEHARAGAREHESRRSIPPVPRPR